MAPAGPKGLPGPLHLLEGVVEPLLLLVEAEGVFQAGEHGGQARYAPQQHHHLWGEGPSCDDIRGQAEHFSGNRNKRYRINRNKRYRINRNKCYRINRNKRYRIYRNKRYRINRNKRYRINRNKRYRINRNKRYRINRNKRYRINRNKRYRMGELQEFSGLIEWTKQTIFQVHIAH